MDSSLDIAANRKTVKYPARVMLARVLWIFVKPFFQFSPRPFFGWRAFLLNLFGARVASNVHSYNSATIYFPWNLEIGEWSSIGEETYIYNLGRVKIGKRATISHRAHLCAGTHDHTKPDLPLLTPPIIIGDQAWICADAFVGPGVTIGEGAVVGARGVAIQNLEPWTIVAGIPSPGDFSRFMIRVQERETLPISLPCLSTSIVK